MGKEHLARDQEEKVNELHWEIQQWKSNFRFIDDEIMFITHLLDSYIFEPNTPNLFERLQNYKARLKKLKSTKAKLQSQISIQENNLGGMLECTENTSDLEYCNKHEKLQTLVDDCISKFQELKSEIFNYAGGILKKRKPNGH